MKRVFFGWQNVNMNTDSAPLVALFIVAALNGMVHYSQHSPFNLDFAFNKIQRYEHHLLNFEDSLNTTLFRIFDEILPMVCIFF